MKSRSSNSIRNSSVALLDQGIEAMLSFVVRTVFIYCLGRTYLGLNGLFSDILQMLSLAELGFGTAILYSMYKPAADGDKKKVAALNRLYRKIYITIGILITIVGIILTPFLDFFISDMPEIPELTVIYLLYLLNTSISYFFSYKRSILIATQNAYIVSIIQIITRLIQYSVQIVVLLFLKNILMYLFIQVLCTLLNNVLLSLYVDKKYTYLRKYGKEELDKKTKNEIKTNVAAMFVSKVSSVIVTSTDNVLISKFVGTIVLGYYSNYTIFVNLIKTVFTKIFEAITGSVGNLVALSDKEHSRKIFNDVFFVNFWLISFCSICLFVLINPFIVLWVGDSYQLSTLTVALICLNMYMRLIRNTQLIFIDTYGLFQEVKIKCILEAVINLVVSILLLVVLDSGIFGVLLGTFISNITTNFWFEPFIIYKKKFQHSVAEYFVRFFKYLGLTVIVGGILFIVSNNDIFLGTVFGFVSLCIICVFVINITFYLVFYRTEDFVFFKSKFIGMMKRVKIKKGG